MKSPTDILLKPLLVEKVMRNATQKTYAFWVARNANKKEIKWAVEEMFRVKVRSVNTTRVPSKPKRTRLIPGKTPERKKAVVSLQAGQHIAVLDNL